MARLALVHWNPTEAELLAEELRAAGHEVFPNGTDGPGAWRAIREGGVEAVLIFLRRLPSHGREVAIALREQSQTRRLPLVFVDGAPDKVARMKEAFPDAWYTTWDRLLEELEAAYASAPEHPVVPRSRPEGYSGTPLPRKLGVSEGSTLALMEAPEGLEHTLGPLPAGVRLLRDECPAGALVLWFVRSLHELHAGMAEMAPRAEGGRLWIAWPKKSSPLAGEVTQNEVRELALAARLVDFKVCAIDADWSGLRFTRGR